MTQLAPPPSTEKPTPTRATTEPSRASSAPSPSAPSPETFVNGHFPRRRALVIGLGVLVGFLLTYLWSAQFVDKVIGQNVANTLLGHKAQGTPITGVLAGAAFALATGVAGTFTACNVAVLSAIAPLAGRVRSRRGRIAQLLKPLGFLAAGAVAVSATYGVVVALAGTGMPQFQQTSGGHGFSPRMIQSMVAFGLIGLVMAVLGLASAGVVRDPLARVTARFANAPMVVMGALVGGFLVGRPYPLFRQLFVDAAERHNPLYAAAVFSLQALGNILITGVLFLVVGGLFGERLHRWFAAKPSRVSAITAAAFIAAGVFMLLYWDVRALARQDLIWFPTAPWK